MRIFPCLAVALPLVIGARPALAVTRPKAAHVQAVPAIAPTMATDLKAGVALTQAVIGTAKGGAPDAKELKAVDEALPKTGTDRHLVSAGFKTAGAFQFFNTAVQQPHWTGKLFLGASGAYLALGAAKDMVPVVFETMRSKFKNSFFTRGTQQKYTHDLTVAQKDVGLLRGALGQLSGNVDPNAHSAAMKQLTEVEARVEKASLGNPLTAWYHVGQANKQIERLKAQVDALGGGKLLKTAEKAVP